MALRRHVDELDGFTSDAVNQRHARNWATGRWGEEHADVFVAWLCALSDDEQHFVCGAGYTAIEAQFESEQPQVLRRGGE
jgi:hypothetical protein